MALRSPRAVTIDSTRAHCRLSPVNLNDCSGYGVVTPGTMVCRLDCSFSTPTSSPLHDQSDIFENGVRLISTPTRRPVIIAETHPQLHRHAAGDKRRKVCVTSRFRRPGSRRWPVVQSGRTSRARSGVVIAIRVESKMLNIGLGASCLNQHLPHDQTPVLNVAPPK